MQNEAPRILVVDDEESITQLVSTVLRYEGFEVECAADGRAAVKAARLVPPRPRRARRDAAGPRRLRGVPAAGRRRDPRVPVLFLTARDRPEDRVHGLTVGADDYVGKPFSLEELVARVRAILRRTRGERRRTARRCATPTCELDEDAHEVRRGGQLVELTPTEFNLLRYLLVNAGRVRQQGPDPRPRLALRLRRRLERGRDLHQLPAQEDRPAGRAALIQTVRGFGYAIRLPRE